MPNPPGVGASLAQKLDYLLAVFQRPAAEIVAAMNEAGYPISVGHMSDLRRGTAKNPTLQVINGIAHVFGIRPAYLLDDPEAVEQVEAELELRAAQRDAEVVDIALRVAGMDPDKRVALQREIARIIREHDDKHGT